MYMAFASLISEDIQGHPLHRKTLTTMTEMELIVWSLKQLKRDGGREVSALDSRSEGPWFKPRWGLKFQGFRIRSFHSTLGQ